MKMKFLHCKWTTLCHGFSWHRRGFQELLFKLKPRKTARLVQNRTTECSELEEPPRIVKPNFKVSGPDRHQTHKPGVISAML